MKDFNENICKKCPQCIFPYASKDILSEIFNVICSYMNGPNYVKSTLITLFYGYCSNVTF